MIKKLLFLFFIFFAIISTAQNQRRFIKGIVLDSLGIVKNVNIINEKSKSGTFSNDEGMFGIYASKGDTISFSSVQHIKKTMIITESIFLKQTLKVILKQNTYTLNEITLKKHNLLGILTSDIKEIPKRKRDSILKNNMDFSNINFNEKDSRIDANVKSMADVTIADPNQKFEGVNLLGFLSLKKKKKYKPIEKNNFDKNKVPNQLLSELGENYFFKELKIPKEKYNHFLEYCNLPKIISLYKKGEFLELIQTFENQSIPYLKIIKNK